MKSLRMDRNGDMAAVGALIVLIIVIVLLFTVGGLHLPTTSNNRTAAINVSNDAEPNDPSYTACYQLTYYPGGLSQGNGSVNNNCGPKEFGFQVVKSQPIDIAFSTHTTSRTWTLVLKCDGVATNTYTVAAGITFWGTGINNIPTPFCA